MRSAMARSRFFSSAPSVGDRSRVRRDGRLLLAVIQGLEGPRLVRRLGFERRHFDAARSRARALGAEAEAELGPRRLELAGRVRAVPRRGVVEARALRRRLAVVGVGLGLLGPVGLPLRVRGLLEALLDALLEVHGLLDLGLELAAALVLELAVALGLLGAELLHLFGDHALVRRPRRRGRRGDGREDRQIGRAHV